MDPYGNSRPNSAFEAINRFTVSTTLTHTHQWYLGLLPERYSQCLAYSDLKRNKSIILWPSVKQLRRDFDLTQEDDAAGFLGIDLKKLEDGSIQLRQDGLVDRVLAVLQLSEANSVGTPAEAVTLGSNLDDDPFNEAWNYRSAVGMLMYLASNSFPEIAFAVHQCARFGHNPKQSHGKAVIRIGRYLRGLKGNGLIIKPGEDLKLDCYADADFAGL
jgi:hypothetical protein